MKNGMFVNDNGDKWWYKDGLLHREDGPAREWDGTKSWWINGKKHREDGPAVELADGGKSWYINGELHRLDGPAYEGAHGRKEWYIDGKLHREDGPAVECANGRKEWYIDGKLHSVECDDGPKFWYINGVQVTEQIVMQPESITLAQILESGRFSSRNNEVRSIMIERYGWLRYIQDSKAKLLDSRDNVIENTKEALFAAGELGNRLVVTCPTGRVFVLGVPSSRKTCEAAQKWLGKASNKINVIGRT